MTASRRSGSRTHRFVVALATTALFVAGCAAPAASPRSASVASPASAPPSASPAPQSSAATSPFTSASPSAAAFPLTLTDDEGTSVTIAAEPTKIVSLNPATTETLFALGVGDRVKGRSEDIFLYPPEAKPIPEVVKSGKVDVEKVVALQPDLVFAEGNSFTPPEAVAKLRSLGLNVVVLYAPNVDTVKKDIELTGRAVGRGTEAATMTDRIDSEFAAVEAAVASLPHPRVYYEIDSQGAYYAPSDNSFLEEMITEAGATPITTGSANKFDISAERLVAADPQLILLADAAFGVTPEQVKDRAGWTAMTAVKNGDIRPIDDQTVTRPGPRISQGLALLAHTIHPDAAIPSLRPVSPLGSPAP
ncbi:MAG: ABC transporter substrate-binding protein [Chloroflexota bacterium]